MTFSIIGRSPDSSLFGAAICSSSPAVAARCVHARAGVGVVATQNITDPALGPSILTRLAGGAAADDALRQTLALTPHSAYRQVMALGVREAPVVHTGSKALGIVGSEVGGSAAAAGNLLARADIPTAMVHAFDAASGHLGQRLLAALNAAVALGGEAGPVHSAGLLIVRDVSWPVVDLRVDWSDAEPVADLNRLWRIYEPQIDDYVHRALDPGAAPSYGVPGDL